MTIGYTGALPPREFNLARYCLAGSAARLGDKVALRIVRSMDGSLADQVWTYAELDSAVLAVAAGLENRGFERGSRLFIRMGNSVDYALMFFGAVAAGLVPIPASSQLSAREVGFMLDDSGAKAIAHSGDLSLPDVPSGVTLLEPGDIADLRTTAPGEYARTGADDPAFLVYTSGTSGRPKGVLHAQRAIWGRRPMYQGWYGLGEDDVVLHTGAFNWTYTLGTGMFDPWANGATTVLYTGAKDIQIWPTLIRRCHATLFASVPTLYRQLLKYCELSPEAVAPLRHCLTAGEALPASLSEAWQEATGLVLYEALGMSEISTYISCSPSVPVKPGSPGRPQAGRCVAILPLEGDSTVPCPAGETGLIAVHRTDPGLMLGYWNRSEDDERMWRGDWFCGGDVGSMDEDGYIWFDGRNDDVMNAFGYRVSPVEVEAALSSHPSVADVAVTEIPVKKGVSVIAAFVVPADGRDGVDTDALLLHAAERIAAYKMPRAIHVVDSLPRTANGKVMRRQLRACAAPHAGA